VSQKNNPISPSPVEGYEARFYPFSEHPNSDTCWSLSTGPDGRIYSAACSETVPGERVVIFRYDDQKAIIKPLFDMDTAVDDPRDSGRATQCKIHYSFVPSVSDQRMYMATHLSGPPMGETFYNPWLSWHDPRRCFRGSALVAYDVKTDQVLWWDTLFPKEGCRCLLHDEDAGLLYALSYPRDHLFVYDIKKRQSRDLGRIGSINSQVLFLDSRHRVWTSDDYGHLVRYDPQRDSLESSPYILPHFVGLQTGWHSVLYDAVADPKLGCVYAVPWCGYPRLFRIWPMEGSWGRVEDLGPVTQEYDRTLPVNTYFDHCGGLIVASNSDVYYVASRWPEPLGETPYENAMEGLVWRMDPQSLEREIVAVLKRPDGYAAQYVSRGAMDRNGDLFFGHLNVHRSAWPAGIFRVQPPKSRRLEFSTENLRMWG
jgi:hypothetical protein